MRKFILGASVALAAAAGPAAAQGLPTQPPAPVVPVVGDGAPVFNGSTAPPAVLPTGPAAPIVPIGGDPYPINGGYAPASSATAAPPYRFYTEGSFLLWFIDSSTVASPLVTSGPSLGILGQPGTVVLSSSAVGRLRRRPGRRVAVGGWLGDSRLGLELSGFYLGRQNDTHSFGGSDALDPVPAVLRHRLAAGERAGGGRPRRVRRRGRGRSLGAALGVRHHPVLAGRQRRVGDGGRAHRVPVPAIRGGAERLRRQHDPGRRGVGVQRVRGGGAAQIAVHDRFGATNSFYGGNHRGADEQRPRRAVLATSPGRSPSGPCTRWSTWTGRPPWSAAGRS